MRRSFAQGVCAAALITALAASPAALAQAVQTAAERVFMDADELIEDRSAGTYTARGDVRLASGDRVIYADEIVYDIANGRITARGGVRIFEGGAPAQTADEVELDDEMREGVAYGFATLLENNGRAAAAAALRRPDGSVELTDAYYTACNLCEDASKEPTWRLRADHVVRDVDDSMIYYRDVRLEIAGVPVAYAPRFAHADPSAERKSGFLLPSVDISNRLGLSYQQPYLWVISPYQDLVIAPRVMTEVNPLLELEWRKRFYSGEINAEASFTYGQEFDADGDFGPEQLRGHIFADGLFALSPDWRWGFGVQAASEDTYLRRYDYNESPEESDALYAFSQQRTLINQLFLAGKGEDYYFDTAVIAFDKLQDGFDDDQLAYVTPLVRGHYDGELPMGLGDFDFDFNLTNLRREFGDDYTRASLGLSWSRPVIIPGGLRVEGFADTRLDAYRTVERDAFNTTIDERNFVRARGAAGIDVSYPFVRPGSRYDLIIAPRTAAIIANGGDPDERPLLQDLETVDFGRSFLFDPIRAPGYDIFEDGFRIDAGLEFAVRDREDVYGLEAFVGRSYRLSGGKERFGPASGLFEDDSDWLADVEVDLGWFETGASARIDSETGEINRIDAEITAEYGRAVGSLRYTELADEAAALARESLDVSYAYALTETWSTFYRGSFDLDAGEGRRQEAGLRYRDECTDFRIFYQRENIQIGNLGPSESLKFEIVLFTLGGVGED
ncbi:MAG: LPS assembly protein LptD [Oceanicaulis sp.]